MSAPLARAAAALLLLGLLSDCARHSPPKVTLKAPAGHWMSLFDGKTLDGWTAKIAGSDLNDNYRNTFRVEGGLLKVSYADYDKFADRFGALYYNKPFSHYWLRAEYRFSSSKLAAGAPRWAYKNNGLQLHSQAPQTLRKDQQFPVSVEFDIVGGRWFGSRPTGDVCRNGTQVRIAGAALEAQCSKLSDTTIRDDRWVTVLAEVEGATRIRQAVNGELVVEYTDISLDEANPDAKRLIAAGAARSWGSGYISIQSNGAPIEFRRIEVLPLDSTPQ